MTSDDHVPGQYRLITNITSACTIVGLKQKECSASITDNWFGHWYRKAKLSCLFAFNACSELRMKYVHCRSVHFFNKMMTRPFFDTFAALHYYYLISKCMKHHQTPDVSLSADGRVWRHQQSALPCACLISSSEKEKKSFPKSDLFSSCFRYFSWHDCTNLLIVWSILTNH